MQGWYRLICEREDGKVAIHLELPREIWCRPVFFDILVDCASHLAAVPGMSMVLPTRENGQFCYLVKCDIWALAAIGFDDEDAVRAVSTPSGA